MKKIFILTGLVVAFFLAGCQSNQNGDGTQTQTQAQIPTQTQTQQSGKAKIFFVDLNNTSKSMTTFGCGDSLSEVDTNIDLAKTTNGVPPIKETLEELFKYKQQNVEGRYNALYQSTLKVLEVAVNDGVATVKITGTYSLGGVCDDPRFIEQIRSTAKQFPELRNLVITINGKPLEDLLSEQG